MRLFVLSTYLVITILLGWVARRRHSRANDFLNATRALPLWISVGAFLAANCGALEIVGLSAVAAQYGVQAFHFYWVGAIPGMVFLSAVMIPVYMRSGVRSLPEFLRLRFDARMRLINAWLILLMGIALGGIGLYAMALVLQVVFGLPFSLSAVVSAGVVLTYVLLGGLRATIYNEIFQLIVIVSGLLPLMFKARPLYRTSAALSGSFWHLWQGSLPLSHHAVLDRFGVIAGLGFVLSFSYWCTDFVLIQRALTARTVAAGRMVPLIAGFGKIGFSLLVVAPVLGSYFHHVVPTAESFDQTLPRLMLASYGPLLLALGMTALLASLMTGLAANVSAFSSVWTEEIYRPYLRPHGSEQHYILVGRVSIVLAVVLSVATSYVSFYFRDLMEYVQLIFSLFSAPFFAIFVLGIFTRRVTSRGAMIGLLSGIMVALVHHGMVAVGWFRYGSLMSANFYVAVYAFSVSVFMSLLFSSASERQSEDRLNKLVFRWDAGLRRGMSPLWWILAGSLMLVCVVLNLIWW